MICIQKWINAFRIKVKKNIIKLLFSCLLNLSMKINLIKYKESGQIIIYIKKLLSKSNFNNLINKIIKIKLTYTSIIMIIFFLLLGCNKSSNIQCQEGFTRCGDESREVCQDGEWVMLRCPSTQSCTEREDQAICVHQTTSSTELSAQTSHVSPSSAPKTTTAPTAHTPLPTPSAPINTSHKSHQHCSSVPGGCPPIEWITISGGEFNMGSFSAEDEQPPHNVTLPTFQIMKTEVTVGMYRACVNAGACTPPGCAGDSVTARPWCNYGAEASNYPVNYVSWYQMMDFAAWIDARLPTEAEWEFVASNRGTTQYPWGNQEPNCDLATYAHAGGRSLCHGSGSTPVCFHSTGNSELGVCDLSGNLYEWTQDIWHQDYLEAPTDGSGWCLGACPLNSKSSNYSATDESKRVMRGGTWYGTADYLRASDRNYNAPKSQFHNVGGRLVRTLDERPHSQMIISHSTQDPLPNHETHRSSMNENKKIMKSVVIEDIKKQKKDSDVSCEEACWAQSASENQLQDKYGVSKIPPRFNFAEPFYKKGEIFYINCMSPHGPMAIFKDSISRDCTIKANQICEEACEESIE